MPRPCAEIGNTPSMWTMPSWSWTAILQAGERRDCVANFAPQDQKCGVATATNETAVMLWQNTQLPTRQTVWWVKWAKTNRLYPKSKPRCPPLTTGNATFQDAFCCHKACQPSKPISSNKAMLRR